MGGLGWIRRFLRVSTLQRIPSSALQTPRPSVEAVPQVGARFQGSSGGTSSFSRGDALRSLRARTPGLVCDDLEGLSRTDPCIESKWLKFRLFDFILKFVTCLW